MRGSGTTMKSRPLCIFILLTVLVALATGCSQGRMFASEAKVSAAGEAPPEPPPALSVEAAAGDKKLEESKKPGAEARTWKRLQLAAHTVRVKIGDREELPVRSMQANVSVDGFVARVALDLVVKNDRDRTYEGTL